MILSRPRERNVLFIFVARLQQPLHDMTGAPCLCPQPKREEERVRVARSTHELTGMHRICPAGHRYLLDSAVR